MSLCSLFSPASNSFLPCPTINNFISKILQNLDYQQQDKFQILELFTDLIKKPISFESLPKLLQVLLSVSLCPSLSRWLLSSRLLRALINSPKSAHTQQQAAQSLIFLEKKKKKSMNKKEFPLWRLNHKSMLPLSHLLPLLLRAQAINNNNNNINRAPSARTP